MQICLPTILQNDLNLKFVLLSIGSRSVRFDPSLSHGESPIALRVGGAVASDRHQNELETGFNLKSRLLTMSDLAL